MAASWKPGGSPDGVDPTAPRPALRSDLRLLKTGADTFLVEGPASGKCAAFGMEERYLLYLLDGSRTLEEVRLDFVRRFGRSYGRRGLREFLNQLEGLGLLEGGTPAIADTRAASTDGAAASDPSTSRIRPQPGFELLMILFGWMLHPAWYAVAVALAVLAATGLVQQFGDYQRELSLFIQRLSAPFLVLKTALIFFLITLTRSLALAVAFRKHGARVRGVRFRFLRGILPYSYCEVPTDTTGLGERGRNAVLWARPMVHLAATSLTTIGWLMAPASSSLRTICLVLTLHLAIGLALQSVVFWRLDGYWILVRLVGVSNLYERARAETNAWLGFRDAPQPLTRRERFWFRVYGLGVKVWEVAFHLLLMVGGSWWLVSRYGRAGALLAVGLIAWWIAVDVRRSLLVRRTARTVGGGRL